MPRQDNAKSESTLDALGPIHELEPRQYRHAAVSVAEAAIRNGWEAELGDVLAQLGLDEKLADPQPVRKKSGRAASTRVRPPRVAAR